MSNEREKAFGRYNFLNKELAKLFVEFSSLRTSLNNIVGGYTIDLDYAKMNLQEASTLINSMKELQNKIQAVLKESDYLKDTYGFE